MKNSKQYIVIFLITILIIVFLSLIYLLNLILTNVIEGIDEILVAMIALIGTLLAAIVNNYYIKSRQLETEKRLEKKKNYDELLTSIGKYIRQPETTNDEFQTIHIKTWIYGNVQVIKLTQELIRINRESKLEEFNKILTNLIIEIRKDIGGSEIKNLEIDNPFKASRGT